MKLHLSSVGNPGFRQDPNRPLSPKAIATIASVDEAPAICRQYIYKYDLGGGNWSGGNVYSDAGEYLGRVSYNGRWWPSVTTFGDLTKTDSDHIKNEIDRLQHVQRDNNCNSEPWKTASSLLGPLFAEMARRQQCAS